MKRDTQDRPKNTNSDGTKSTRALLRDDHLYNVILRAHALVIIFSIVVPILIGGLGNGLMPRMLDVFEMALPQLGHLSF